MIPMNQTIHHPLRVVYERKSCNEQIRNQFSGRFYHNLSIHRIRRASRALRRHGTFRGDAERCGTSDNVRTVVPIIRHSERSVAARSQRTGIAVGGYTINSMQEHIAMLSLYLLEYRKKNEFRDNARDT